MDIAKYDQACRGLEKWLEETRHPGDVKEIRNRAVAIGAYAKVANNHALEADAWEVRIRSERRLGQVLAVSDKDKGGRPAKNRVRSEPGLSYNSNGIGKRLAQKARWAASMTEKAFTLLIGEGRGQIERSVERSARAEAVRKTKHQRIHQEAREAQSVPAASVGPFNLIYADPPWRWGNFGDLDTQSEKGMGRSSDQHYPTMTYEQIIDYRIGGKLVSEIAHKDSALFLWCTSANLVYALSVMTGWGFEYKAHAVWVKDKIGLGLVFRNQHELLLYGTRGNMPGPQYQPSSVFEYPRGKHSAKPPEVRQIIEKMYPDFDTTRAELFARGHVHGWTTFGFEALQAAE